MPDERQVKRAYVDPPYALTTAGGGTATLDRISQDDARRLGLAFSAMEPWSGYRMSAASLGAFLGQNDPGCARLAIRIDGDLAGAVAVREPWLMGPYLQFLGLLPARQRIGLGRAVLDWMAAEAPRGARNLWLCVTATNTRARAFYERNGFVTAALLPDLVADRTDEVLMRRQL